MKCMLHRRVLDTKHVLHKRLPLLLLWRDAGDQVDTPILGDRWETKEQSEELIRANINYTSVVGEDGDEFTSKFKP